jgi:hypothetical protein
VVVLEFLLAPAPLYAALFAPLQAALLAYLLTFLLTAVAKQPGPLDAAGHPPDAKAMAAGSVFGIEVFAGIALPQVFGASL